MTEAGGQAHWDAALSDGVQGKSWHQDRADVSLALFDRLRIPATATVVDVGGAASVLAPALLGRGHEVSVLDVSDAGLNLSRALLGEDEGRIHWIRADLLTWQPGKTYAVWHDRALAHFFTTEGERTAYRRVLDSATAPRSVAIIATFALDGPDSCSGLPVQRHDVDGLGALVGPSFELVHEERQLHRTPSGAAQSFLWTAWRKLG